MALLFSYGRATAQFSLQSGLNSLISGQAVSEGDAEFADFNNDGMLDLVVTGRRAGGTSSTRVYVNNGTSLGWIISGLTDLQNSRLDAADYDNNGTIDLAICGENAGVAFTKIFTNSGLPSFLENVGASGNIPQVTNGDLAWGDYDNDGDQDLIITGYQTSTNSNITRIIKHDLAAGTFAIDPVASINLVGLKNASVIWVDYDLDGKLDLIMNGQNGNDNARTYLYKNLGNAQFALVPTASFIDLAFGTVASADVNNDGYPDMMVCGEDDLGGFHTRIYLNQTGINPGVPFVLSQSLTGMTNAKAYFGDFDNDGWVDVISAGKTGTGTNDRSTIFYLNDQTGQFAVSATSLSDVDGNPALAVGDYSNPDDGKIDLFLSGITTAPNLTNFYLYENTDPGTNTVPSAPTGLTANVVGSTVEFSWNAPSNFLSGSNAALKDGLTYELSIGTLPNDDDIDPANAEIPGGKRYIQKYGNIQDTTWTIVGLASNPNYWVRVQAIDAALEGSAFSAAVNFSVIGVVPVLSLFDDSTSYAFGATPPPGPGDGFVSWCDCNADGNLDVLYGGNQATVPALDNFIRLYTNDGDGTFQYQPVASSLLPAIYQGDVAWGDVNNDGRSDLAVCGTEDSGPFGTSILEVYISSGNCQFGSIISLTGITQGSVDWGDVDRDGDLDLLVSGKEAAGKTLKIYLNSYAQTGTVSFSNSTNTFTNAGVETGEARFGDYDNDGDLDFAVTGSGNSANITKVFRNDGTGIFTDLNSSLFTGVRQSNITWADLDNDGTLELIVSGNVATSGLQTSVRVYKYFPGFGLFLNITVPGLTDGILSIANGSMDAGDYDNDGLIDLLVTGQSGNNISSVPYSSVYKNLGNLTFQEDAVGASNLINVFNGSEARFGDYNNDHKLDVLLVGTGNVNNKLFKLYKNSDLGANETPNAPQNPSDTLIDFDVHLSWDAPAPPATNPSRVNGYSYELYIDGPGTGPFEILSPQANLADGYRRIVKLGQAQQTNSYTISGLAPGTYTWGVQAIDQDWEGSAFLTGGTFDYQDPTFIQVNATSFPNNDEVGMTNSAIAWGDYHGDGHLDVIISGTSDASTHSTKLYQYDPLNQIFLEDPLYSNVFVDVSEGEMDWGDFDNDGDLDLAITGNSASGPVSRVYINISGGFTMTDTLELFPLKGGAIKWGDFNNDGFLDLIQTGHETNGTGHTIVYRNTGTGSLITESTSMNDWANGDIALADFDQDGLLDIVVSGSLGTDGGNGFTVLYENAGEFSFSQASVSAFVSLQNSSLDVADVDANGFPDLIIAGRNNGGNNRIRFVRNNNGITWSSVQNINGPGVDEVAFGDFNDDGFIDLVVVGESNTPGISTGAIYSYNQVSGLFVEETVASANVPDLKDGASAAWADFDQDGKLDLLTLGTGIGSARQFDLLRNLDSTPNFVPGKPVNPTAQIIGDEVVLRWQKPTNVSSQVFERGVSYQVVVGTTSGGTDRVSPMADLTTGFRQIVKFANAYDTTAVRLKGLPAGTYFWGVQAIDRDFEGSQFEFGASFDFELPTFEDVSSSVFPSLPPGVTSGDLAFADYDVDGDMDLMVAGQTDAGRKSILYRNNNGNYNSTLEIFSDVSEATVSWIDMNGDNRPDLFLSGNTAPNTPFTGLYFSVSATSLTNSGSGIPAVANASIDWADVDRDGDMDAFLSGRGSSGQITDVYLNNGNGDFKAANAGLASHSEGNVAAKDFTGDGIADLFITGKLSSSAWSTKLYRGMGDGTFVEITSTALPSIDNSRGSLADVDGDGDYDLAFTGGTSSGSGRIYLNNGSGSFSTGQSVDGILTGESLWGDLDENGRVDLLVLGNSGSGNIASYYRNSASGLQKSSIATIPVKLTNGTAAAYGDFSGDGKLDLAVIGLEGAGAGTRSLRLYENIDPAKNQKPSPPTSPTVTTDGDTIIFSWTKPSGTGFIVDGYSYQLVIGTTNTATDVVSPLSAPTSGIRFVADWGTHGQVTEAKIVGLPDDTYHWGIQTIDQDFDGSGITYGSPIKFIKPLFIDNNSQSWSTLPGSGLSKSALAWADFDGDGNMDLAAAGEEENGFPSLTIYSQKTGGLALDATASQNLVGVENAAIAWADIDLDGDPDLLVSGQTGTSGVQRQTRLYRNVNGVFVNVPSVSDSLPQVRFGAFAVGDVDQDGDPDLAITGEAASGPVAGIYLNDNGTFSRDRRRPIQAVQEGDLEWGDFDNDGDLDLALSGANGANLFGIVYRNRVDRGDFVQLSTAQANLIKTKESSLAWVDYDNDGDLDLMISGETSATQVQPLTRLYEFDSANDEFNQFTTTAFPGFRNGDVAWGDLNDDGWMDVVLGGKFGALSTERRTAVYLGSSTGSFSLDTETTLYLQGADEGASLALADFDNDGKLDVAMTGQVADANPRRTFTLYKNINPNANINLSAPRIPTTQMDGDSVRLSWIAPLGIPGNEVDGISYNVILEQTSGGNIVSPLAEVPGGFRQIVYRGNAGNNTFMTIRGLESGQYTWRVQAIDHDLEGSPFSISDNFTYTAPSFVNVTNELLDVEIPGIRQGDAEWGDYDADGDLDLIITGRATGIPFFTELYENIGSHTLNPLSAASIGLPELRESAVAWQDIDGDGDLDLAMSGLSSGGIIADIYQNNGTQFQALSSGIAGVTSGDLAWIDADADGDPDLLVTGTGATADVLALYLNDEGSFSDAGYSWPPMANSSLAVADINKDGLQDFVVAGNDGTTPRVLLFVGDLITGFNQTDLTAATAVEVASLAWMDMDHDGDLDLFISGSDDAGNATSELLSNDGTGIFTATTPTSELHLGGIALGDVNEDGFGDIFLIGENDAQTKEVKLYRNDLSGLQEVPSIAADFVPVSGDVIVAQGDFTGDGLLDFLINGNDGTEERTILYESRLPVTNSTPGSPRNLDKKIVGSKIELSWNPPAGLSPEEEASLTYNVSLERVADGKEAVPGQALASGFRQIVANGNAGQKLSLSINDLQEGEVYRWTVQAIDQDFEGSAFPAFDSFSFDPPAFDDKTGVVFSGEPPVPVTEARIELGDYDGDGDLDLIAVGETEAGIGSVAIFRNVTTPANGGKYVQDTALTRSLTPVRNPALAWQDVNGDGFLDLLLAGLQNDGTSLTSLYLYESGNYIKAISGTSEFPNVSKAMADWADYDRDGDMDLALAGIEDDGTRFTGIFRQTEPEVWELDTEALGDIDNFAVAEGDLSFGDFDSDGDIDLAIAGTSNIGPVTRVLKNDGTGKYSIGLYSALLPAKNCRLDWGDLNNDGDLDLLITGDNSSQSDFVPITTVYEYLPGDDRFQEFQNQDFVDLTQGSASWGDFNNDGWLDILISGKFGQADSARSTRLYRNLEGTSFIEDLNTSGDLVNVDLGAAAWGDYNGDQKLDVFLTGRTSSSPSTYTFVLFENIDTLANVSPIQPLDPSSSILGRDVTLSWDSPNYLPSTFTDGLTYNVLLYKDGESTLLLPAQSDSITGYRRIVRQGNVGHNLSLTLTDLEDGKYFWKVQTVDQDFEGSVFSETLSFTFTNPIPAVIAQDFPDLLEVGGTAGTAEITINDPTIVDEVIVFYKGIASADWQQASATGTGADFSFSIENSAADEMGLEYVFQVIGTFGYDAFSDTGYTYMRYPNGFDLTDLRFGKKFDDYDIIGIPLILDNNQVGSVIEEYGEYNNRQWRLWSYENSSLNEFTVSNFSTFNPGQGYWLISKEARSFNTGAGRVVEANDANPYEITLTPGFNQIGSPFPFAVSWSDILAANPESVTSELEDFLGYEEAYVASDRIKRLRGGFVFAHAPVTLKVPVRKNPNVQRGELRRVPEVFENPSIDRWFLPMDARIGSRVYKLGGFGMAPEADPSRDPLDRMLPPRFGDYIEMVVAHPDYFYESFTRDISAPAKNHVWEFTVETNLEDPLLELNWDAKYLPDASQGWLLFDVDHQKLIDLKEKASYRSLSGASIRRFRLYMGDQDFLSENAVPDQVYLGSAYPNPAQGEVSIPFTLPPANDKYDVRLIVKNHLGQEIATLMTQSLEGGFHEFTWDGLDGNGRRVAAGLYLYQLEVSGGKQYISAGKLRFR